MINRVNSESLKYQFFLTNIVFYIVNFVIWGFYLILLYKATGSLIILLLDSLVFYIGLYLGSVLGTVLLDRIGYKNVFRLTNILHSLACIFILILLPNMAGLFILFALMRGIPRGLFWNIYNNFHLKEMHGARRGNFLWLMGGIIILLGIVLPGLSGALISYTKIYELNFAIGAMIYLIAALFPWKYNKLPRSSFNMGEVVKITQHRNFSTFGLLYIFTGSSVIANVIMTGVIPFVIIGDEFGVGLLSSFLGLITAFMFIIRRNKALKERITTGFFAFVIDALSNLGFVATWNLAAFTIRGLLTQTFSAFGYKTLENIDYENRELILDKDISQSAVEITFLAESLHLIGRVLSIGSLIVVLLLFDTDAETNMKIIVVLTAFTGLITYVWSLHLRKKLRVKNLDN